jgi:hypothetical protein
MSYKPTNELIPFLLVIAFKNKTPSSIKIY